MKQEIKKGIVIALSFAITLGMIGGVYAAFVNITEVNTSDTLTSTLMNNVINNQKDLDSRISGVSIPSGFVGAFNLSSCPIGWSVADGTNTTPDLRGAFIRGMNGDVNSRDVARVLGSYQEDDFKSHTHEQFYGTVGYGAYSGIPYSGNYQAGPDYMGIQATGGDETRPKNVALLYCIKD